MRLKESIRGFINDVVAGIKVVLSGFKLKEVKNIISLEEETLRNVDQELLERSNKFLAQNIKLKRDYKTLFRETYKSYETSYEEILREQKKEIVNAVLDKGVKVLEGSMLNKISVYTKDLKHKLGELVALSYYDGEAYIIYKRPNGELDFLKGYSIQDIIDNFDSLDTQKKHKMIITNFIIKRGELILVPKRYDRVV